MYKKIFYCNYSNGIFNLCHKAWSADAGKRLSTNLIEYEFDCVRI